MINTNEKRSNRIVNALKIDTKTMVIMAILIAIQIILSRFLSINTLNLRIGFGFVPIVIAGIMFGAVKAGIVAGISDILGALLFSLGFTPLITITAVLTGVVFGLFLYKKQSIFNIVLSVLIVQIVCSLLLNSYFIYILYFSNSTTTLLAFMLSRVTQTLILIPVEIVVITALSKVFLPKLHILTAKN